MLQGKRRAPADAWSGADFEAGGSKPDCGKGHGFAAAVASLECVRDRPPVAAQARGGCEVRERQKERAEDRDPHRIVAADIRLESVQGLGYRHAANGNDPLTDAAA